ncbi:MAG: cobalamin biosynthesis protein [Oligoflexia bacterium]|nr:cobalamin biosynthesis protein [Oligoflexia bacterium]
MDNKKKVAIYAVTSQGVEIGRRLFSATAFATASAITVDCFDQKDCLQEQQDQESQTLRMLVKKNFYHYHCHVFILSIGAVVRIIAGLIKDKKSDPAVICIDEFAKYVIPILSGHIGGGNQMALYLANLLGTAEAIITTASDSLGRISADILGKRYGWVLEDPFSMINKVCSDVVNGRKVIIFQEAGEKLLIDFTASVNSNLEYYYDGMDLTRCDPSLIIISDRREINFLSGITGKKIIFYRPKSLIMGVGCDRGFPSEKMDEIINNFLRANNYAFACVCGVATVDLKANEDAILNICKNYNWRLYAYSDKNCFWCRPMEQIFGGMPIVYHYIVYAMSQRIVTCKCTTFFIAIDRINTALPSNFSNIYGHRS